MEDACNNWRGIAPATDRHVLQFLSFVHFTIVYNVCNCFERFQLLSDENASDLLLLLGSTRGLAALGTFDVGVGSV